MKHLAIILALVCMSATATRAEWRYHKTIDPLDDSEIHFLGSMPTNQTDRIELSKPTMLAIRIQNGETIFGIVAIPDTITEKTFPVVIRFNRKKARKIQCRISKDHELLFPPNQKEFLEEILSCNGLIVSLDTAFGRRIDFFDLRGLDRLLKKHNLDLFPKTAQTPEPVERLETREPTPAAVKARKEKAAHAVALPESDVDERIADLTRAYAEKKLHPKRLKLLDLKHYPHKSGTVWIQRFDADGKTWRTGYLERPTGELNHIPPQELKDYLPRR